MQPICLVNANDTRHEELVRRTRAAIEELAGQSKRISFYSVAEKAGIARSTLYRSPDLRQLVKSARAGEAIPLSDEGALRTRIAELEQELEIAKREIQFARRRQSPDYQYACIQLTAVA